MSDSTCKYPLTMTPTEYFKRQCYVAYSGLVNREDLEGARFSSVPNVIWGADVGHGEGIWPSGLDQLRTLVQGLPEKPMRKYLGEDLHRAFPILNRDYSALLQRIAPSAGQLGLVA
jgi:hypothetical protein